MKLLILGGSNVQLNAARRAKEKGHTVIISDYYEDAPAKKISDYGELVSTFDADLNIEVAGKYGIDGVLTLGTDQPVYTAVRVACEYGLPALISPETAKAATNKKVMKKLFKEHKIPTLNYRIIGKDFSDNDLRGLRLPVVVKPLDSQGQRGVYKLDSIDEIRAVFPDVLSFSREKEILAEEYYPSDEITVSGWVHKDKTYILTVTDRICYNNYPHIGICIAHNFPSKFLREFYDEILHISENIVRAFEIHEGPIYFQMLIGSQGIKVNEIACRIGGAYEDEFIPEVTGVDILDMLIEASLGKEYDTSALKNYQLMENTRVLSVRMIFASPSTIKSVNDMEIIKELPGVLQAKYNFKPGYTIRSIENATARAGYMIITGENSEVLNENIRRAYGQLKIYNENNENMIINFSDER